MSSLQQHRSQTRNRRNISTSSSKNANPMSSIDNRTSTGYANPNLKDKKKPMPLHDIKSQNTKEPELNLQINTKISSRSNRNNRNTDNDTPPSNTPTSHYKTPSLDLLSDLNHEALNEQSMSSPSSPDWHFNIHTSDTPPHSHRKARRRSGVTPYTSSKKNTKRGRDSQGSFQILMDQQQDKKIDYDLNVLDSILESKLVTSIDISSASSINSVSDLFDKSHNTTQQAVFSPMPKQEMKEVDSMDASILNSVGDFSSLLSDQSEDGFNSDVSSLHNDDIQNLLDFDLDDLGNVADNETSIQEQSQEDVSSVDSSRGSRDSGFAPILNMGLEFQLEANQSPLQNHGHELDGDSVTSSSGQNDTESDVSLSDVLRRIEGTFHNVGNELDIALQLAQADQNTTVDKSEDGQQMPNDEGDEHSFGDTDASDGGELDLSLTLMKNVSQFSKEEEGDGIHEVDNAGGDSPALQTKEKLTLGLQNLNISLVKDNAENTEIAQPNKSKSPRRKQRAALKLPRKSYSDTEAINFISNQHLEDILMQGGEKALDAAIDSALENVENGDADLGTHETAAETSDSEDKDENTCNLHTSFVHTSSSLDQQFLRSNLKSALIALRSVKAEREDLETNYLELQDELSAMKSAYENQVNQLAQENSQLVSARLMDPEVRYLLNVISISKFCSFI